MNEAFRTRGKQFDDEDVARCYAFRAPYPASLFEALLARVPGRSALLDLGTGNGKIAGALAPHFVHIDAVDPSSPLLGAAKRQYPATNINWILGKAETAQLNGPYSLITAGVSLHWMDPAIVFPKLAAEVAPQGALALISGDGPTESDWHDEWRSFVRRWVNRMGGNFNSSWFRTMTTAHLPWIDIKEQLKFRHELTQSVEDFVECQHSRETFARKAMGEELARAYDRELSELLMPYTTNGKLSFTVECGLTLGLPRAAPLTP